MSPTQFSLSLPAPSSVADLFVALADPSFPSTHGLAVYAALPGGEFRLLGAVTPSRPSAVLRTGWPADPAAAAAASVTVGVSVETLANLQNLGGAFAPPENRLRIALNVAKDLFNFMASFGKPEGGQMTVPVRCFEMWVGRFEDKYRKDPDFMLKIQD
ncbi:hypothetical protein TeGR_g1276 [Tetraparma gracilis]|uniref:Hikeshi-like domain-containing protein n=1 Tax=Tetraparma gracilis TaxID=2962635 RepID=A0ABQ6MW87_9STRA|nr:hypothetical protein TeGR_g1276 [Tetraparma gracilis]